MQRQHGKVVSWLQGWKENCIRRMQCCSLTSFSQDKAKLLDGLKGQLHPEDAVH
jgi:hypothetical protein